MKHLLLISIILFSLSTMQSQTSVVDKVTPTISHNAPTAKKLLRHIVLLKFKENTTPQDIESVEKAFSELPTSIKEIYSFEWGINNSPEGLDKGFTHSFLITFLTESDRAIYLPHPAHLAFVEVLKPHLDDVLVVDYWSK